ncbi:type I-E CRISPR-associated protein Cas7/Cse4/CasC [Bifidobacterium aquikefiricola]|uniref:Type I-E CRISPR-associated protein Cas7/Cse4/CasC n=1 Tax=Bifidobacterium aquikefiricola TaxID=3059038 RepID=A0AB39U4M8_9BIFI
MTDQRLFIDIHAIQSVPPSNINRDDTGSPKTAQYGGVVRARVSSQAWKKAMRDYFREHGELRNVGTRTLEVPRYIADEILKRDDNLTADEAIDRAVKVLNNAGVSTGKDNRVKALFFIGYQQAQELAEHAVNEDYDKASLKSILKHNTATDIALFGRMVADDPSLNEDASAQVAHAISTHAVQTEFDYFTGTDDLAPADNAGAGMLGTIEYNSSTLYRYANVAAHELVSQLGDDKDAAITALKLFVEAFITSMPTGKINTFANQTLPSAVVIVGRSDRPINLVNAFETPVKSREGYIDKSIDKLRSEFEKDNKFVESPAFTLTLNVPELQESHEAGTFGALLNDLDEQLRRNLK